MGGRPTRPIHRERDQNRHLALDDTLTGLPNRALFRDRLAHAVAAGGRAASDVTVAIIDLDRFREVNDTLVHANGDRLLCAIGERLSQTLRPGDTVAQLGADEFGLVLPGVSGGEAARILQRVIAAISEEIELEGIPAAAEVCIGWAEWPTGGDDIDELLRQADVALYPAKTSGGEAVHYDSRLPKVEPTRRARISELRAALASDQLVLESQPKSDLGRNQRRRRSGRVAFARVRRRSGVPSRPTAHLPGCGRPGLVDHASSGRRHGLTPQREAARRVQSGVPSGPR